MDISEAVVAAIDCLIGNGRSVEKRGAKMLLSRWCNKTEQFNDDELLSLAKKESNGMEECLSDKNSDARTIGFIKSGACDEEDVVLTQKLRQAFLLLDLLSIKGVPVLIQGPICSGKTSLISLYAKIYGRADSVRFTRLQLHDQMDSKSLIGNYVVAEEPGQFIWQPGPLTEAARNGYWLLLEDLDAASADALSAIVHLAEFRTIRLPNCNRPLQPHKDFRLFATLRTTKGSHPDVRLKQALISNHIWSIIELESLASDNIKQIVTKHIPAPKFGDDLSKKLLQVFQTVCSFCTNHQSVMPTQTGSDHQNLTALATSSLSRLAARKQMTLRDFVKFVRRIDRCLGNFCQDEDSAGDVGQSIWREAVDVFSAHFSDQAERLELCAQLSVLFSLSREHAQHVLLDYKASVTNQPEFHQLQVGRAVLSYYPKFDPMAAITTGDGVTSFTRHFANLLETVCSGVILGEPILLVGETGCGKTYLVQHLAKSTGHSLHVANMSQQTDATDLLGGYRPVDFKVQFQPLKLRFEALFSDTFSLSANTAFLSHLQSSFSSRSWPTFNALIERVAASALASTDRLSTDLCRRWKIFSKDFSEAAEKQRAMTASGALPFTFVEGLLVRAVREGFWLLLDEINLAPQETLDSLAGLMEGDKAKTLTLYERGVLDVISVHPDFRLFACMNPATDVGKKPLPDSLRARFSEIFVPDPAEMNDLRQMIGDYLSDLQSSAPTIITSEVMNKIALFYLSARQSAKDGKLTDGSGGIPHFSIRTLCRALGLASKNLLGKPLRSLAECLLLSFLTQLNTESIATVTKDILTAVYGSIEIAEREFYQTPTKFRIPNDGTAKPKDRPDFILTATVSKNIEMLSRVVSLSNYPVLLQGETAVGKTSTVQYIADLSGNRCIRLNNHEHTDLSEYVGSYTADQPSGQLVFRDGPLVSAMRNGYWVILDELNLAPGDVLEALNRVLDDNREIVIPETQEVVKAHPRFRIFATQNPPGAYAGRKMLSRAFRNRFIELHFCELPDSELEVLVSKRCSLPPSHARRLVAVMRDLAIRRRRSGIFAGRKGFMTMRDLFRWARRYSSAVDKTSKNYDWNQHLADHGYLLLAGQARNAEDETTVVDVLQKHFKCKLEPDTRFFDFHNNSNIAPSVKGLIDKLAEKAKNNNDFGHLVFTKSLRRMAVLISSSFEFGEPVLLVGDTGCGKTTLCQLIASANDLSLITINCHLHTEAGDFIGSLRPAEISSENQSRNAVLFAWQDGPLTKAMQTGSAFLIDEISLADDSVLERLNSVLDADDKSLIIPEKTEPGSNEVFVVHAKSTFRILATMNPAGDFGKRELSPALRNRFTEVYCAAVDGVDELSAIAQHTLSKCANLLETDNLSKEMAKWLIYFTNVFHVKATVRDLLQWAKFIINPSDDNGNFCLKHRLIDGAMKAIADALPAKHQQKAYESISTVAKIVNHENCNENCSGRSFISNADGNFVPSVDYCFSSPTTSVNLQRLLRALTCDVDAYGLSYCRPILLEGPPGVGKTSLVSALAKSTANNLVRINLSEQTDLADLFGAHFPQENGGFAWVDGPLLRAFKSGDWVLVDELNLASQPVLEGLNACLDHRRCATIPELGIAVRVHEQCRFFGAQNPSIGGGGRKNLPRSFLNRFTQVYIDQLTEDDYEVILKHLFPKHSADIIKLIVRFNSAANERFGALSSSLLFNLRDLTRWCELALDFPDNPGLFVHTIFAARFNKQIDRQKIYDAYTSTFDIGTHPLYIPNGSVYFDSNSVCFGSSRLAAAALSPVIGQQNDLTNYAIHAWLPAVEVATACCNKGWMVILYGDELSGKTSVVRYLARMTGRSLTVLPVTPSLDATDLLGSYEQVGWQSQARSLLDEVYVTVIGILADELSRGNANSQIEKIISLYKKCGKLINSHELLSAAENNRTALVDSLKELHQSILDVPADQNVKFDGFCEKLLAIIEAVHHRRYQGNEQASSTPAFVWSDSALVTAMRNGEWLLVDNANFCSPAVLDRLNSLFEPGGRLYVHERGSSDAAKTIVKPHPEFRIFLTANPKFGELSRAVRNRGIEIYLPSQPCHTNICSISRDLTTIAMMRGLNEGKLVEVAKKIYSAVEEIRPNFAAKVFADVCTKLSAVSDATSTAVQREFKLVETAIVSSLTGIWRSLSPQQIEVLRVKMEEILMNLLPNEAEQQMLLTIPRFFHWKLFNIQQDLAVFPSSTQSLLANSSRVALYSSRFSPADINLRLALLTERFGGDDIEFSKTVSKLFSENQLSLTKENAERRTDIFWHSDQVFAGNDGKMLARKSFLWSHLIIHQVTLKWSLENSKQNALWNLKSRLPPNQQSLVVDVVAYCLNVTDAFSAILANDEATFVKTAMTNDWPTVHRILLIAATIRHLFDLLCQPIPAEWMTKIGVVYRVLKKYIEKVFSGQSGRARIELFESASPVVESLLGGEMLLLRKLAIDALNNFGTGMPLRDKKCFDAANELDGSLKKLATTPTDRKTRISIFDCAISLNSTELQSICEKTRLPQPGSHLLPVLSFFSRSLELKMAGQLLLQENLHENVLVTRFASEISAGWDWLDLESAVNMHIVSRQPNKAVNVICCLTALLSRWSSAGNLSTAHLGQIPWMPAVNADKVSMLFYLTALLSPSSVVSLRHVADWRALSKEFQTLTWNNVLRAPATAVEISKEENNVIEFILRRFFCSLLPQQHVDEDVKKSDLTELYGNVVKNSTVLSFLLGKISGISELLEVLMNARLTVSAIFIAGVIIFNVLTFFIDSDPADIAATRLAVVNRDCEESRAELEAFDIFYLVTTGRSVESYLRSPEQSAFIHPRSVYLSNRLDDLAEISTVLRGKQAYRPTSMPFEEITSFLTRIRDSLLSPESVSRVLDSKGLSTLAASVDSSRQELARMTVGYPDLLIPAQFALSLTSYGLSRLINDSTMSTNKTSPKQPEAILANVINDFIQFPRQIDASAKLLRQNIDCVGTSLKLNDRDLAVAILYCYLRLLSENPGKSSSSIRTLFLSTFSKILSIWREASWQRCQYEAAQESLYSFKVETHCDGPVTDEEKDEADVAKLFPSYDKDFKENNDDEMDTNVTDKTSSEGEKTATKRKFVEQEADVIDCRLLCDVMEQNFQLSEANKSKTANDQFFQLLFGAIFNKKLSISKITAATSSHELAVDALMSSCLFTSRRLSADESRQRSDDFYFGKSSCDATFISMAGQLTSLRKRLVVLLTEWPEHPQLTGILRVVDLVLDLPASSTPPAKILAGLERVYEESQIWQQSAGKTYSLNPELGVIIETILTGRRRQLDAWAAILEGVAEDAHDQACVWLMKFADVVFEQCGEDGNLTLFSDDCVKFLQTCQVGEFKTRLKIVRILSKMASLISSENSSSTASKICNILANVASFYAQFEDVVADFIADSRKPIESELKEFVKISRWNDANFWQVRNSVHQAHKKLARARRLFAEVLVTPIGQVMTADRLLPKITTKKKPRQDENIDGWKVQNSSLSQPEIEFSITFNDETFAEVFAAAHPSLPSWPDVLRIAHERCVKVTSSGFYGSESLDNLSEQVFEAFVELSSVSCGDRAKDGDSTFEKNVKALQQQKLRALTDLFHKLTDMGLSYRAGLNTTAQRLTRESLAEPLLVDSSSTGFQQILGKADAKWWRLLSRFHLLDRLVATPHEIIGPRVVERARGNVCDLARKLLQQRKTITLCFKQFLLLTELSTAVNIPPASESACSVVVTNLLLLVESLTQWLKAAPNEDVKENYFLPTDIKTSTEQDEILKKFVLEKSKLLLDSNRLENVEQNLRQMFEHLITKRPVNSKISPPEISLEVVRSTLNSAFTDVEGVLNELFEGRSNKFSNQLTSLRSSFFSVDWKESELVKISHEYDKSVDDWMVVEQKLAKFANNFRQIGKELASDVDDVDGVITKIEQLLVNFESEIDTAVSSKPSKMLEIRDSIRPFIVYSTAITSFVLYRLVRMHVAELKFANIISGIFASLLANGLCLPSLSKGNNKKLDVNNNGACQLVDIQDGGFGEDSGDGMKDVSQKIESSDQIEDLQNNQQAGDQDKGDDYLTPEDDAIEMPDDLDSKVQDDKKAEKENGDDDGKNEGDDGELDKKMGDAGSEASENVDVEFWQGSDDEGQEDNDEERRESDEKTSKGEKQSAPELGAADARNKKSETGLPDPGQLDEEDDDPNRPVGQPPSPGENDNKQNEDNLAEMADDLCLDENEKGSGGDEMETPPPDELNAGDGEEIEIDLNKNEEKNEEETGSNKDNDGDMEEVDVGKNSENRKDDGEQFDEKRENEQDVDAVSLSSDENEKNTAGNEEDETTVAKNQKNPAAASSGRVEFSEGKKAETAVPDEPDGENDQDKEPQQGEDDDKMDEDNVPVKGGADGKSTGKWAKEVSTAKQDEQQQKSENQRRNRQKLKRQPLPPPSTQRANSEDAKRLKTVDLKKEELKKDEDEDSTGDMDADEYARMEEEDVADEVSGQKALDKGYQQGENREDEKANQESDGEEDKNWWQSEPSSDEASKNDMLLDEDEVLEDKNHKDRNKTRNRKKKDRSRNVNEGLPETGGMIPEEEGEIVSTLGADRPPENRAFTNLAALTSSTADTMQIDMEVDTVADAAAVAFSNEAVLEAEAMWNEARQHTEPLAAQLCERLRAILEPSVNSKFKGDFRSGKRLNVRRLVAYAASGGRRDRIWLRRCEPGRRRHRVLLAVDDSHSMSDCRLRRMAVETLSLLAGAFSLLEIGELAVCSFGESTRVLQPFADPFLSVGSNYGSGELGVGGSQLVSQMKFDQPKTGIAAMIAEVARLFLTARMSGPASAGSSPAAELLIILTDGRGVFAEGQSQVRRAIRTLTQELSVFPLVLVLDNPTLPDSIFDIRVPVFSSPSSKKKSATAQSPAGVQIVPYLDLFPFPFYVVVRDLNRLPEIVADALTQWIDMVQNRKTE